MWTKFYKSSSSFHPISEPSSWSRTPLSNISHVTLKEDRWICTLTGITGDAKYWQSDDFIQSSSENKPTMIKRRIEIQADEIEYDIAFEDFRDLDKKKLSNNEWFIIEIDLIEKQIITYTSPNKI